LILPPKKFKLLFIGIAIVSLSGTGCSLLGPKGPTEAEIAQQKKIEKQKAEKVAAEKEAAKKQAAQAEDTMEMVEIKTIEEPAPEKLPEVVPEEKVADGDASSGGVVVPVAPGGTAPSGSGLAIPTEPNTYLVTVAPKDNSHPYFSQGDDRGFLVNGKHGQYVIAKRGDEIKFNVRTGVQHDFYLTTAPKGWGAAPYTAGVEGQYTYNGDVTFKPTKATPNDLYYGCRNHNSMGGRIVVVDPDADLAQVMKKLDDERALAAKNVKSTANKSVKPEKVSQKIAYVAMLMQFKGKGLEPDHKAAIQAKLDTAKKQEKKGELAAALASAEEAGEMFKGGGAKKSGPTKEEIAEQKEEMNDLMITLEAFIDSHKASYEQTKSQNPEKLVDYDHDLVEKLVTEAVALSEKNQFEPAKKRIKKAERLVTKALNDMLNSQTIVYDLNFETPAEEYAYEVKKYEGYLELIPVAIEVKKPGQGSIKLMETYVKKGKFFKEKADEAAKGERWEEAMVVIRDATIEVRRGLRLLGVSM